MSARTSVFVLGLVAVCGTACGGEHAASGSAATGAGTATATGAGTAAASATGTATATATATATGGPVCPEGMVLVPAGTFRMGSTDADRSAEKDEKPAHDVKLPAYCIGRTEVTVAEYEKCAQGPKGGASCSPASKIVISKGLAPSDVIFWSKFCNAGQKDRDNHPLNCVSFAQAQAYCAWAGGRLPSEAEWERAARGEDGRRYPWGDEAPSEARLNACGAECARNGAALGRKDKKTMFAGDDGAETTAAVGGYPAGKSPVGALDMAGNVWEWTADVYGPYEGAPDHKAPAAATGGAGRVVRGGHWLNANPESPRAANRESRPEEKSLEDVGFRCAATPR